MNLDYNPEAYDQDRAKEVVRLEAPYERIAWMARRIGYLERAVDQLVPENEQLKRDKRHLEEQTETMRGSLESRRQISLEQDQEINELKAKLNKTRRVKK